MRVGAEALVEARAVGDDAGEWPYNPPWSKRRSRAKHLVPPSPQPFTSRQRASMTLLESDRPVPHVDEAESHAVRHNHVPLGAPAPGYSRQFGGGVDYSADFRRRHTGLDTGE